LVAQSIAAVDPDRSSGGVEVVEVSFVEALEEALEEWLMLELMGKSKSWDEWVLNQERLVKVTSGPGDGAGVAETRWRLGGLGEGSRKIKRRSCAKERRPMIVMCC
jgi:hypothetical protein